MHISRRQIIGAFAQVVIQPRKKPAPKNQPTDTPSANLRVDTSLVLIPVTVGDPLNRPVVPVLFSDAMIQLSWGRLAILDAQSAVDLTSATLILQC